MNSAAMLLLADPSPALRYRVLTELLDVAPSDAEAADLAARRSHLPELDALGRSGAGGLRAMSWTLCRLAFLGFGRELPLVRVIAERLLAHQADDGSFPLEEVRGGTGESRYSRIPLQVSLPLRGLAATGYATDPRVERAYQWLLDQRLDDGAWPLGVAAGQPGYIAGYRRLPGSKGCRVNTEAAIACLVLHPERRRSDETRRALDLLLQRETREEWSLGSEVMRLATTDEVPGFVTSYARFDLAFVLELASRAGASADDTRIRDLVAFLLAGRGREGLWEHPERPELGRWLTLELLLSLGRLAGGDWIGGAPRLPFRALRRPRR